MTDAFGRVVPPLSGTVPCTIPAWAASGAAPSASASGPHISERTMERLTKERLTIPPVIRDLPPRELEGSRVGLGKRLTGSGAPAGLTRPEYSC